MADLKAISPERAADLVRAGAVLIDIREATNTRASTSRARVIIP